MYMKIYTDESSCCRVKLMQSATLTELLNIILQTLQVPFSYVAWTAVQLVLELPMSHQSHATLYGGVHRGPKGRDILARECLCWQEPVHANPRTWWLHAGEAASSECRKVSRHKVSSTLLIVANPLWCFVRVHHCNLSTGCQ